MPISLFLKASKERVCVGCGEAILRGHRYWRQRLRPACLGCHTSGEVVRGPNRRRKQALDYKSRCRVNGDNENKKGSPSPTGFLCKGQIVNGEFVPEKFYLTTDSLEDQEVVQAFLEQYGFSGEHTD